MKVSVIVPCLNGAATVAVQLAALANQQWSERWEVVIADNGSSDGTLQIINKFKSRLPNLRIVDASGKRGSAYARNVGIRAAASDRFVFCDVDDEVAPGWVASMGEALAKHEFVVSKIEDSKLNASWLREIWGTSDSGPAPLFEFLPAAAGYGFGFTRALYERVGEFDESLLRLSDIDYSWRVQLAGVKLHFVPEAVVHYRFRPTLRGMYRQAYLDGQYQVVLYKKYARLGMPWRSGKAGMWSYLYMLKRLAEWSSRRGRTEWMIDAGFLAGRLRGSIRHRTLVL